MPRFGARKFTDRYVASLKSKGSRRIVFDASEPGIGLRLGATARTWVYVYRAGARIRFLSLGHYPALSLAAARKLARAERVKRDQGRDPAAERKVTRTGELFEDLATSYLKHAQKVKRTWGEDARIVSSELLPRWRDRKVKEIRRRDVRMLLAPIAQRAPVAANRTWALISKMFNYAIGEEMIDANPASRIPKQPETSRDRVLSQEEIRAFWQACTEATAIPRMVGLGLQAILVTAQRPGEVFGLKWDHLDLPEQWEQDPANTNGWWNMPASLSKNKNAHRVPLTGAALVLLREARTLAPTTGNAYVFAGERGGSTAGRAKKAGAVLSRILGFEVHRHDLRRTAASGMGEAGVATETIARVLNHIDRGPRATRIYDRYSHDDQKQAALTLWARRLTASLEAEREPATVLPFARG